ncbi:unnamed protein product [Musa textilis]
MVYGPKMSSLRAKTGDTAGDDPQAEVEDLLWAAKDDVLLKLRVGGHIASRHTSSSLLDYDLARRFEALKAPPPHPPSAARRRPSAPEPVERVGPQQQQMTGRGEGSSGTTSRRDSPHSRAPPVPGARIVGCRGRICCPKGRDPTTTTTTKKR